MSVSAIKGPHTMGPLESNIHLKDMNFSRKRKRKEKKSRYLSYFNHIQAYGAIYINFLLAILDELLYKWNIYFSMSDKKIIKVGCKSKQS